MKIIAGVILVLVGGFLTFSSVANNEIVLAWIGGVLIGIGVSLGFPKSSNKRNTSW